MRSRTTPPQAATALLPAVNTVLHPSRATASSLRRANTARLQVRANTVNRLRVSLSTVRRLQVDSTVSHRSKASMVPRRRVDSMVSLRRADVVDRRLRAGVILDSSSMAPRHPVAGTRVTRASLLGCYEVGLMGRRERLGISH